MKLILMRHGDAMMTRPDHQRRLSEQGRREVQHNAGLLLERLQVEGAGLPGKLISSPLVRAQETAALVASVIGFSEAFVTWPSVVPEADCLQVAEALGNEGCDHIMLVTHQPFVSMFIQFLTDKVVFADTATIACLSMEVCGQGCGVLEWVIQY
ncbi:MAG: phosphohistidine phosphatase SixA [Pseudomonadales bacterium]|nr:phosphohistidine phosphatase SixA [Pseudomonadales bacterium]